MPPIGSRRRRRDRWRESAVKRLDVALN